MKLLLPDRHGALDSVDGRAAGRERVGAMRRLLVDTVGWAGARRQFGERILDFQGVSFPLADSAADASAARLLTREAAWMLDEGMDPKVVHARASLAKLFDDRPAVYGEINKAFTGVKPASTGIVVAGLAMPELLMEIDAWGIVDD